MAQYKDGDTRTINGVAYVRTNGQWMPRVSASPLAAPDLPYKGPSAAADLTGKSLDNKLNAETLADKAAQAHAERVKAEIDAKNAQDAYDAAHPKTASAGTVFGADYLKTLPGPDQELVKALAEGRLAFPGGFALKAPWWQQKLEQVAQYDPSFDATNYNNRAKARAMLLTGKVGGSANALNTAIGHLGLLSQQIGGVASHNFTPFNSVENALSQTFGSAGVTNFKDTAKKLADELESVYRNGGGTEQGVMRQLQSLDPNASLEQKQGIIRNALELLASKQAANLYQYGLAGGKPPVDLLDPAARKVLDQFPDIRDKYFGQPDAPLSRNAAAILTHNGGTPPSAPPPSGAGFAPPPTGPTNGGLTPSTDGYNDTPDPQSASFWADAARQGTTYRDALHQWQSDVRARGFVGITPPPPGAYHKAQSYIRNHPNVPYQPFNSVTRTPVNPLDQAATDAAFSGIGVGIGHAANSLAANLPTALAGDQGARYNAVSNATHPNYALAGDLAGTVGGALATGAGLKGVAPALGRFGQMIAGTPGRAAFAGDTLFGGLSGAAQNPDNPAGGALLGAGSMAAGNVAGRYILGPAIRGGAKVFNKTAGMFGAAPLDIPPPLSSGENMIFNRANPVMGDIRTNLQDAANLNLPYSLADANPRLRLLAGSAARKSPDIRAMAEDTFGPRQAGQGERAIAQINNNLAPVGDVPSIVADTTAQARAASRPLYEDAFSRPAPDLAHNPELAGILRRPAAEQALRRAYDTALNDGVSPADLSITIGQDGRPLINANPTWKTLHYVRRGLDEEISSAIDPVTGKVKPGMGDSQRAMIGLRGALDEQIGNLNPGFKAADAEFAKYASQGTAAQRGAAATGIRVTPEQTQIALASAGDNLPFFRRGYASDLADQVERSRLTSNPYNAIYGSMGQRAKIGSVFPQGASNFARANALEGDMAKTGTELFGGSQTQPRAEADRLFDNPAANLASDAAFGLATGVPPPSLIRSGIRTFAPDLLRLGLRGGKEKADQIGPMLLNTDPGESLRALDALQALGLLRKGYVNRTGTYGGMFGAPLLGAPVIYGGNQ